MQEHKYGTWSGVFVPTLIGILGVIMYLRQGWVVGNAGLLGTWLVIFFSAGISFCTALSLSSIATNTRLHAGGVYAIISRSLGLEAGASIGITLFLAQSLAVAMYIFGFREGCQFIFGAYHSLPIDLLCFAGVFVLVMFRQAWAKQAQYIVLAVILVSLVCVALGDWHLHPHPIQLYGDFVSVGGGYSGFWATFAVFFPGVTGVMAGVNLSGDLENPKKNIPLGSISAVLLSAFVYLWLAWVLVQMAPMAELRSNKYILIEKSAWNGIVQIAMLCATFSSALVSFMASPRILQSLAQEDLVPFASVLKKKNANGTPQNAIVCTGILVLLALGFQDINLLAPIITICFLTTYASVNGVVLIEQGMGLISFRPRLRIPLWIPFLGVCGATFSMLVINPSLSIVAFGLLILFYAYLTKTSHHSSGDVRGNLFSAVAQWVAREAIDLPRAEARAWVPHPMMIVHEGVFHEHTCMLAMQLADPRGSIKILNIGQDCIEIQQRQQHIKDMGIFCSGTSVSVPDKNQGIMAALQVLQSAFFRPNIVLMSLREGYDDTSLEDIVEEARKAKMGVVLGADDDRTMHEGGVINVWIRAQEPDWDISSAQKEGNLDLALLMAIQLTKNPKMKIRLVTMIENPAFYSLAEEFLLGIIELGRLPRSTSLHISPADFWISLAQAPAAELQIFGFPHTKILEFIDEVRTKTNSSTLFVRSSGTESILL